MTERNKRNADAPRLARDANAKQHRTTEGAGGHRKDALRELESGIGAGSELCEYLKDVITSNRSIAGDRELLDAIIEGERQHRELLKAIDEGRPYCRNPTDPYVIVTYCKHLDNSPHGHDASETTIPPRLSYTGTARLSEFDSESSLRRGLDLLATSPRNLICILNEPDIRKCCYGGTSAHMQWIAHERRMPSNIDENELECALIKEIRDWQDDTLEEVNQELRDIAFRLNMAEIPTDHEAEEITLRLVRGDLGVEDSEGVDFPSWYVGQRS